jgi:uncharacterized protein YdeI (BOF family)
MKKNIIIAVTLLISAVTFAQDKINNDFNVIEKDFAAPPYSVKTAAYYYWMNDHISKEGVIKDLHAMKEAGINRVFIATNIRNRTSWSRDLTGQSFGKVKVFTEEWYEVLHTALKTATELDIEVGLFNCPGWSQSGGPWVKPEQAMRYLASSELYAKGPTKISQSLSKPDAFFQDVKVIAFPVTEGYGQDIQDNSAIKLVPSQLQLIPSAKKDSAKYVLSGNEPTLDIILPKPTTVRKLSLYSAGHLDATAELFVKVDADFKSVKKFEVFQTKNVENLAKGFKPDARFDLALGEIQGKEFRIVFHPRGKKQSKISKISLDQTPVLNNYIEKSLARVASWGAGKDQNKDLKFPQTQEVLDISKYMSADGVLNWNVPAGNWLIMRMGMRYIDVKNGPASFEAEGLEVDKMSAEHIAEHFDAFIGDIMKRVPPEDRKTLKTTVIDSYERGGQNFTDGFLEEFKQRYGYDATPFLPVYDGHIIGNVDLSERFLWDLRRLLADDISYKYVGGLRDVSHKYGLTTWLENYGHSGFAGESLQYGGQSDEVAGEYWWSPGKTDGKFESRIAASAAHIYGKNKVWAESFTSGSWTENYAFSAYPADLKRVGDWAFIEGINSTLLHVYIQQPYEDKYPGVDAWFGTEFNRKNTWFSQMDLFTTYHKRCNYMLQQGLNKADVAYFTGEDVPQMSGTLNPSLPTCYDCDFINAEVILRDLSVKDGQLVLPHGTSYRILVLPKKQTMRPELLKKIEELVAQGAVILGSAPSKSPSLQGYPKSDLEVQQLAQKLWGDSSVKQHSYGKGMMLNSMNLSEALALLKVTPDFLADNKDIHYKHRTVGNKEIYFLTNSSTKTINFQASFRVKGLQPELWNPLTGEIRVLTNYEITGEATVVPLQLAAAGSAFIVFRNSALSTSKKGNSNFEEPQVISTLNNKWEVQFENDSVKRGPLQPVVFDQLADWSQNNDERIRYFSGTAVYSATLNLEKESKDKNLYLDLGDLSAMAKVKINGVYVGGVWTVPYRVNVTGKLHKGKNKIEITVVNTWKNRLIGDYALAEKDRIVHSENADLNAKSPLQKSGLLGPVTLIAVKN